MIPELGDCYYPEHWPAAQWATDAGRPKGFRRDADGHVAKLDGV